MKITKAVAQLREKLIESINASGLPPVVVELVVGEVQAQLRQLTQEEYRKELENEQADERADETAAE